MYTQFFGNYLLKQGYVNQEQLFGAMQKKSEVRMKLGTLAIHKGYMTAEEVDATVIAQTHQDIKFGELAIMFGYLTEEQVDELIHSQSPDFLLLGQILVDEGVLTNSELEKSITEYRSANEVIDLDMTDGNKEAVDKLFEHFFQASNTPISRFGRMYFELIFNNFIRFIGDDFTPQSISDCKAYPVEKAVRQQVNGAYSVTAYIGMDESTAIRFASRYVGETFDEFDEYVQASLEDFLNLHNGLFIVNVSNEASVELTLSAPEVVDIPLIEFEHKTWDFQILYSFGIVHFLLEVIKTCE